jgi:hypothetical protein
MGSMDGGEVRGGMAADWHRGYAFQGNACLEEKGKIGRVSVARFADGVAVNVRKSLQGNRFIGVARSLLSRGS